MRGKGAQGAGADVWRLAARQHGIVTRAQLLGLGLTSRMIEVRIATGRLHPVWRGTYAVGRPGVSRQGIWMAAVLTCGSGSALSHESAGALWRICAERCPDVEVSIPVRRRVSRAGILVHRRAWLDDGQVTTRHGIPVTTPICTLVDLATRLTDDPLEAAINEADKLDLVHPEELRVAIDRYPGVPGAGVLARLLDRRTFATTDSVLERRFLAIVRRAGLPKPETGRRVNGFKVDFYWPELGLVVETDGLRYHRTPAQQAKDHSRDRAHATAGLTSLRFSHADVTFDPGVVEATLTAVVGRLKQARR
jgi:very-short-patch-repair endonuclease